MKRVGRAMVFRHRWNETGASGPAPHFAFAVRPKGDWVRIQVVVLGRSLSIHW